MRFSACCLAILSSAPFRGFLKANCARCRAYWNFLLLSFLDARVKLRGWIVSVCFYTVIDSYRFDVRWQSLQLQRHKLVQCCNICFLLFRLARPPLEYTACTQQIGPWLYEQTATVMNHGPDGAYSKKCTQSDGRCSVACTQILTSALEMSICIIILPLVWGILTTYSNILHWEQSNWKTDDNLVTSLCSRSVTFFKVLNVQAEMHPKHFFVTAKSYKLSMAHTSVKCDRKPWLKVNALFRLRWILALSSATLNTLCSKK